MRIRNPLAATRLSVLSTRAPDDCYAALVDAVCEPGSRPPSGAIVGKVKRREFSVFVASALNNAFPTLADGKLVAVRGGTRIDLRLGAARWALLWWLGAMLALGLFALTLHQHTTPIFAVLFLFMQFLVSRWLARRDESRLIMFLRETLDARIIEPRVRVADGRAYREVLEDPALEEIEVEEEEAAGR